MFDEKALKDVTSERGWQNFAKDFEQLAHPLRPSPADVGAMRNALLGQDGKALLLGVTPELADLGVDLTAVDKEERMLASVWPGDSLTRRAILGNWLALPFAEGEFTAVFGDGSINAVGRDFEELLVVVRRLLRDDGVAAFRVFCAPRSPERFSAIKDDVLSGWQGNVSALAWRIAMASRNGHEDAIVPVCGIFEIFSDLFPDHELLAARTGWSPSAISLMRRFETAAHSIWFPTLDGLLHLFGKAFSEHQILTATGYPLAERCPTIRWTGRSGA